MPLDKPYYGCSFQEAFLRFWKKYTVFKGRASRSEFWWWVLAAFGINIVLDILNTATDEKLGFLATIWGLVTLIPTLALSVRRLHDTNKPGWWVAIFYIAMVIGLIIMIIGGGAALYGGFRSLGSYDYGYGSMAAGRSWRGGHWCVDYAGRLRCLYRVHGSSQQAGGRTF